MIIVTHSKKVSAIADEIWGLDKGVFRQLPVHKNKEQESEVTGRETRNTSSNKKRR